MSGNPFYWSREWRRARALFLKHHPQCDVEGCLQKAEHVDHRKPISQGGARLDPANLRAMCHSHHSFKTAAQDGGFGNRYGGRPLFVAGADANGNPVDPNHHWNKRDGG